jgi:hypothetical protein
VAVGIMVFAWAANPRVSEEESTLTPAVGLAARPVPVLLSLTPQGHRTLSDDLGRRCGPADIVALALIGDVNATEVVTLPSSDCRVRRFRLTANLGIITATGQLICNPVGKNAGEETAAPIQTPEIECIMTDS